MGVQQQRTYPVQRLRSRRIVAWFIGLGLLVCASVTVCVNRTVRENPASPNPPVQPVETSEPVAETEPLKTADAAVAPPQSADRVVVDAAAVPTELTLEDGNAIKAGLLEQLEQSTVDDRDFLLEMTQNAPVSIENGRLRIGIWTAEEHANRLELLLRGPFDATATPLWGADVTKQGEQWSVGEVMRAERLRRR
jgi:hypothetical protein